jgi:hypothetical protein
MKAVVSVARPKYIRPNVSVGGNMGANLIIKNGSYSPQLAALFDFKETTFDWPR